VDAAVRRLPDERSRGVAPCYTAGTPLVDLAPPRLDTRLLQSLDLPAPVATGMARRLRGAAWWAPHLAHDGKGWTRRLRALAWWAPHMAKNKRELDPLIDGSDLTAAEVRVHLAFGAVLHLDDLLLRRARIGVWQPALARALVPRLRPVFEQELGWAHGRWEKEVEAFDAALQGWSPQGVQ
jgi:glycerol-3-phosphate dehydrogenase